MQSLIICTCGCKEFKKENNMIVCSDCGKKPENSEKAGFLAPTDEKSIIALTKLGINIGAEAANVGAGVLIGIVAPWSLPFTLTALGVTIQHGADALSNMIEDKFYSPGSYGEQISSIFEKVLNNALKRGKKGDEKYASFYNYHVFCSKDYLEIVSKLIDKDVSIDIYSDEAIRTIISDEFMYPGREDAELLNKILRTAKEVRSNFENKVIEDKNLGFRWLIEKISAEHNEKIEKVITLLGSQDTDNQIDDDTYEYIKNYQRPLFLDINTGITLGKMYLDPIVVNHNEKDNVKAIDVVMDWVNGYSNEKLLMVFGAAGVGKTSFITKIISDICSVSGNENAFNLTKDKVHPIILRNNISEIEDMTKNEAYSALKAIIKILDLSVSQLAGHLIILDGFDELCVLSTSFKGESFLKKLYNDLKSQNIKILITSRPMEELKISNANIPFINIEWTEKQVSDWCDKFSELTDSNEEKQWCSYFKSNYNKLFSKDESDNRLRMFSTPIILYLACKSNTIISEEDTIGKFYDKVFRQIAERKHTEYHIASGVYDDVEKEWLIKALNWQYTKELAYQMFLNDTLILTNSDENNKDHIQYAKKRTFSILHERGENIPDDMEIDSQLYLAVSHFASGNEKGIEFVHKTVYEYFTAVKLYEDYFSKFNSEYFDNTDILQSTKEIWNNIIEAFRYSSIPKEIFNYLNEMNLPAYIESKENSGFDYQGFEKCTIESLNKHILSDMDISKPLTEYKTNNDPINFQIERTFRNLTWFLSGHGFNNNMRMYIEIKKLISQYISDINFQNWILNEADLTEANLNCAILNEAHLEKANLTGANLKGAHLNGANLKGAHLNGANLRGVHLNGANLVNAEFYIADLRVANLNGANLNGANLSGADLRVANLENTEFYRADLNGAHLSGANLNRANLSGANLGRAHLNGAHLNGAHLSGADLSVANLENTEFYRADLSGANLGRAHLRGANLSVANLNGANLMGASLMGANLNGAKLKGASLMGANLNGAKLKGAKLIEANLMGANLDGANLSRANLSRANLIRAKLNAANLMGADLRTECLTQAYFDKAIYCIDEDCLTIFPKGFDPKSRGMIEVDVNGNLINES